MRQVGQHADDEDMAKKLTLVGLCWVLLSGSPAHAQSFGLALDSVSGLSGPGRIKADTTVVFWLGLHNLTVDTTFDLICNGFRIYSPDSAEWASTVPDTTGQLGLEELGDGLYIKDQQVDGIGADTVCFGGSCLFSGSCIPPRFEETAFKIEIGPIPAEFVGQRVCIDSSWYAQGFGWGWSSHAETHKPSWSGCRCFAVTGPDRHDVGIEAISAPKDTLDCDSSVQPSAIITNLGSAPEAVTVSFSIGAAYADTLVSYPGALAHDTVFFAEWAPPSEGSFPLECVCLLPDDQDRTNDTLIATVAVVCSDPYTDVVEGPVILPSRWRLAQNYPNPFNSTTVIEYSLSADCFVKLAVYNSLGQEVARLIAGCREAGDHQIVWDGTNDRAQPLGSGVYLCRLTAAGREITRKMVLLR